MSIKILGSALATAAALGVLAVPANAAAPGASQPAMSSKAAPISVPAGPALAAEVRTVCAQDAWVRESDLSHVKGVLYYGNTMTVDRYVWKSTGASEWAVGTAHTTAGDVYGYVEVYPSNPFC
ncbi:hypothetical protein [Streptomyces odontomachi]|uniref:hypothetical protein n=1 Tax=Streptomyces odontomachi TaxID=2944940 RepID=UPI00210A638C|nr:hypothetical protein [Streptomyces sp. ODS25]